MRDSASDTGSSDLSSEAGGMPLSRLLAVAGHVVALRWRRLMSGYGLTPHGLAVLAYLERGEALTQRELARRCGVAASTLNHTVDQLEKAGWVERRRDTTDRRLVRLALTFTGARQLLRVQEAATSQMEPLLDHLEDQHAPLVRAFLAGTIDRIQAAERNTDGVVSYPV